MAETILDEAYCWDILDTYFTKGNSAESVSPLVKHQIDSYNKFINTTLPQIISGFNPIKINTATKTNDADSNIQKIYINVLQPALTKPMYQLPDGTQTIMTPHIARMNNLTYSSSLFIKVHIVIEIINEEGMIQKLDKYVNNVYIGKIPIMVRSNSCVLHQIPGIGDSDNQECRYDFGGYFIVNGNEKVLIMQDRINENDTLVFAPNNNTDGIYAEIRSMNDLTYLPSKTTSLNMIGKLNHMGRNIRLNTSFLRTEIPVFIMFRALGIISDKEIIEHIVYDTNNKDNQRIISQLMACCEDASDIHTQEQAEEYLIKNMTGINKNSVNTIKILRDNIINDFLPHVGKNYRRKALYLGHMIFKMIRIYLEYDDYDNRDSYMNKRIDTPGVLMSNLFRQCYGKMTKEIKGLIERELNLWRANHSCLSTDIISDNNIHRFFKHSLLESWLKYSLSTGNWGIKSIGSFQNIRQGVSQVLNRMSYASTLSHLRRISTAMEKNGKLVQPRKLDNSQINMICPAETPEGASVGLVKNIALSTNISIAMNSTHIRNLLVELGTNIYDDSYSYIIENNDRWFIESEGIKNSRNKASDFLKEMGNPSNVSVQINGDIIGYHTNPVELYKTLKHYKRCSIIYPMTAIIWNILKRTIIISTEAGRMYRPVLIVDYDEITEKSELRIIRILREKKITWEEFIKNKSFDNLISPNNAENEEGIIEYLDCNEINHSMIAMNYQELYKIPKGNNKPIHYTNCEIHPSLMNGVLGANIPFSNHNQSPRNCYQCLNENEKVMLSNGSMKLIKDMSVGDEVVCFNPNTKVKSISKVVNHYNRITSKTVYNIKVISGRSITATYDHKFMTNQGWTDVKNLDKDIKLGIIMGSDYQDNTNYELTLMTNNLDKNTENYLKLIGLTPLNNNHYYAPIISRLVGYYMINNFIFKTNDDETYYNNDVISIGFEKGYLDIRFRILLDNIITNLNSWIYKSSSLIKSEFLSGYFSNYFKNSEIAENLMKEFEIPMNWDGEDNKIIARFYNFIGIHYNHEKLRRIALIHEYYIFRLESYRRDIYIPNYTFEAFKDIIEIQGDLMFIPFMCKYINTNNSISDITIENTDYHSFIGGNGFAVSNCAMGKQALGIYTSNFNNRTDTMGNIINYPQKHLVSTRLSKYTYNNELPSGVNAIVAIMTHTGFNQEDSVMINKSALDRGLFTSTYYKVFRDQCTKNHSSGEEEIFINPKSITTVKPYSYDKLEEDGFIPKNTYIDNGDIIVGKVMPRKVAGKITYQDNSISMKSNDDGYIDMNYTGINSDGYKFCKIRIRKNRKPEIGDKLACYSDDHEYLTTDGWINVSELTLNHKIASMVNNELIYQNPVKIHKFDYEGEMYYVNSSNIDIMVTPNHRMLYRTENSTFQTKRADELYNTNYYMKKDVDEWIPDYSGDIPKCLILDDNRTITHYKTNDNKIIDINDWLLIYANNINETLDDWVWYLNRSQANQLINKLNIYNIRYSKLADDIQRLALHAGYSANKITIDNNKYKIELVIDNEPNVNNNDKWVNYNGIVYCCTLANNDGTIYVRRNGKPLWSKNSTSAQKGSIGMIYEHKDMPFTKEGIVPDIIINPHAIPSRMTMAQLMECIMGKVCCSIGAYGDSTPFTNCTVEGIAKNLEKTGLERYGNEIMYNGRTGEQIKTEIFIGPTYYQRLKHMVTDKIHSRGSNGPIVMLTRQCSEGRARGGGLRLGEMERDCFIGHGSALFLKEKMLDCADNYRVFICKDCGMIANVNPEKNIYKCIHCKNASDIVQIRIPYAFKLLTQELTTMNVIMRYICE
jgi:DNA-directed RNA polymerase beta subunit